MIRYRINKLTTYRGVHYTVQYKEPAGRKWLHKVYEVAKFPSAVGIIEEFPDFGSAKSCVDELLDRDAELRRRESIKETEVVFET